MNTIDDIVDVIQRSKNIIVICGAGISVSCGIPDFRSEGIGIYNTLNVNEIGIPAPELLFDADYFDIDPSPFYKYAKTLLPDPSIQPSITHQFFAWLESQKKLKRVYTQNIDGLERVAGVTKVVECHGTMNHFICTKCRKKHILNDTIRQQILLGHICKCTSCQHILKPGITFFGDNVPNTFESYLQKDLKSGCDLILVTGTSLQVQGSVYKLLNEFDSNIYRILVNRNRIDPIKYTKKSFYFHGTLLGNCDDVFSYLAYRLQHLPSNIKLSTRISSTKASKTKKNVEMMKRAPNICKSSSISSKMSPISASSSSSKSPHNKRIQVTSCSELDDEINTHDIQVDPELTNTMIMDINKDINTETRNHHIHVHVHQRSIETDKIVESYDNTIQSGSQDSRLIDGDVSQNGVMLRKSTRIKKRINSIDDPYVYTSVTNKKKKKIVTTQSTIVKNTNKEDKVLLKCTINDHTLITTTTNRKDKTFKCDNILNKKDIDQIPVVVSRNHQVDKDVDKNNDKYHSHESDYNNIPTCISKSSKHSRRHKDYIDDFKDDNSEMKLIQLPLPVHNVNIRYQKGANVNESIDTNKGDCTSESDQILESILVTADNWICTRVDLTVFSITIKTHPI